MRRANRIRRLRLCFRFLVHRLHMPRTKALRIAWEMAR